MLLWQYLILGVVRMFHFQWQGVTTTASIFYLHGNTAYNHKFVSISQEKCLNFMDLKNEDIPMDSSSETFRTAHNKTFR
jgi:hypothetical protein